MPSKPCLYKYLGSLQPTTPDPRLPIRSNLRNTSEARSMSRVVFLFEGLEDAEKLTKAVGLGWLVGWLVGWVVGWLVGWLVKGDLPGTPKDMGFPLYGKRDPYKLPIIFRDSCLGSIVPCRNHKFGKKYPPWNLGSPELFDGYWWVSQSSLLQTKNLLGSCTEVY